MSNSYDQDPTGKPQGRRVLFLAPFLSAGGVTTHMLALAGGLQARGWQVGIATGGPLGDHPYDPAYLKDRGIAHFQVPFNRTRSTLRHLTNAVHALRHYIHVIQEFRPDLVHVHWRSVSWYTAWSARKYNIPFVTTLHQVDIPATLLHRAVSFWGRHTMAVSHQAGEDLSSRFRVPQSRITIVHNGIDETYFRPPTMSEQAAVRAELGVEIDREAVVCMIASLEQRKRHDLLLHALAGLKAKGIRATALMAGSGPMESHLMRMTESLDLTDQVHWLGYSDVRAVLWASDVFVLPSDREAFPLSVVEAMSCGVVPIRTPAGGADEQIRHQKNGFIMPFDDVETLIRQLHDLFTQPDNRKQMADAAVRTVHESFTVKKMVDEVLNVYAKVLGST